MLTGLSLRVRILLFFALIAIGGAAIVSLALYLGYRNALNDGVGAGFVLAGVLSGFGLMGLAAGIWLLFDENVAKPIERIAATMRTHAHARVDTNVDTHAARYLGDLAPAAAAVSTQLSQSTMDTAQTVATETERLLDEKRRLTALLSEIPVAMVLVSPAHKIVLYDGQAAEALAQVAPPRLNASVFDYLEEDALMRAHARLDDGLTEVAFDAVGAGGAYHFEARLKPLGHAPGYMILIDDAHIDISPEDARPLTYDFDLVDAVQPSDVMNTPLMDMTFVVFDSETTGLLPHKDEIVQLGAVRVLNGRIVAGEQIDQLVNPGMTIPAASTKVHHITNEMVANAPSIKPVADEFHHFARGSVIVAHNAPFDMAFLHRQAKSMEITWDHPILDTVLLSAVLFGASETHTLDALCDRLNVTIPPDLRHTALGDAQATAEVLCHMLPMLISMGHDTFGKVIEQTRKHGRLLEDLN
ncbi:3'-5' exonuclease [Shimia abyssi]|uniref:DNA-directed DNA polymerase n=1 Tax=Shimia abyssi TaxID=1662395 RepID=A0A2P8FJ35_9RHOB|nr:3'-5' exonuclease [Shimia abyssi]PSL21721.1 DNA polymerase-3 subunit epsilon [Shimia abyssi]